jgi:hexosaminidase
MNVLKSMAATLLSLFTVAIAHAAGGDIIPRPATAKELPGQFTLSDSTTLFISDNSAELKDTADVLENLIAGPLGVTHPGKIGTGGPNSILLTTKDADKSLGDEGYELVVHPDSIVIRAATSAGLFYGIQSLRQLLPPEIEKPEKVTGIPWTVPCVEIKDSPRYAWRGLMLDVSRHFFDKGEVEHVLDLMALHKMNRFHWHLTDDQGWRIEIKKYPKLTEVGAWRDGIAFNLDPKRSTHYRADGKYGGFYTQEDIREVVAYAAKLHITVIPEIEMPGHSQAALAAYPQFSCTKKAAGVGVKAGVMDAIYDAGDDAVFGFLDDVLTEVSALFPAEYIHIGGDEVPKGPWKKTADCQARMKAEGLKNEEELQSYFIKRVEKIVESKHRRLIGWDEILEGGLAPNATVMSWRGIDGGIAAAKSGHDVVMTPTSNCYFDYSQTKRKGERPTIGGYLPLERVYSFDPTPAHLTQEQARHVLGGQGNLWTEYVPNLQQAEYQLFPRACAMAEATWSPADQKDYSDFLRRWKLHRKRLDVMGVTYFHESPPTTGPAVTPIGTWVPAQMSEKFAAMTWDASKAITKPGRYRVTMQYTGGACRLDIAWVALEIDGKEIARDTHDGRTGGSDSKNEYELTVPALAFKNGAKLTLVAQVRSDGGTDSNGTVTIVPVQ